ncbi:MAG: ATP-binding cassette domain-containing protein [Firmicutes bacterium]|nr:ATP-binding cassette domain-containing protein [Bacillota bacterium]MCL5039801.1 ATP-binding cassette domain-containing protein [Bacillota bacterium]
METNAVIEARQLQKTYGQALAVKGIDFSVQRGECFGFLGPNGAGKTSTMKMIYGRTSISGGELYVLGFDAKRQMSQIKGRVGVVPQENNLDPELTVLENLILYGRYFGMIRQEAGERARARLDFLGLEDKAGALPHELSGGMKRRLIIARALLNDPEILILDEPTTGLDPRARHVVWQKLAELREAGSTLILTTHYMEEAARLCDRLVVMDHGQILARGEPTGLVEEVAGPYVLEINSSLLNGDHLVPDGLVRRRETVGGRTFLFNHDNGTLLDRFEGLKLRAGQYLARPTNLEDVFLILTGRSLEE